MPSSQKAQRYADTRSALDVQTHAHTRSTLDAGKQIKKHTKPSICADTCTHTLSSLGTCRGTLSAGHRKLNEDTCSALKTCQPMLSSRDGTRSAHQDTRSALKTCQQTGHRQATYAEHMQAHTQLLTQATESRYTTLIP
jgi:hypothetical protein